MATIPFDSRGAKINPFPSRQPPEQDEPAFSLVPLEPEQSDSGTVWGFRIDWDPCGQPGGKPDLPAA